MGIMSVRFSHRCIAKADARCRPSPPRQSPPVLPYLKLDQSTWPPDDVIRLRYMTFRDLEKQFNTFDDTVRAAVVTQLRRFVVDCTFT